jgi:hypothetical protein
MAMAIRIARQNTAASTTLPLKPMTCFPRGSYYGRPA